ncbi:meiotic nuclear division protein 1 homolog isoform X2 [Hydractinia symbiolongicarpus]|uniref:meiotic nuclear division protein 1 homolog isoform X2 n=1 Tax=Hydractinia symbiolongicarpus TaxID=13093 RepID=UPI00254AAD0B|nr:meiotic nuclear division protein 1 homolog isoform X2 [Hydractinia symbiolongicarpus]
MKTFFQLKELEKIAPKEKGITPMSVKDVLQSLVDDNLVDSERIGTSNYFWSFPSKAVHTKKRKIEVFSEKIDEFKRKKAVSLSRLEEMKKGKENTNEREQISTELEQLQEENKKLSQQLEQYRESDPEVLKEVSNQCQIAFEAANRWTDNLFSLKSWCSKKFNVDTKVMDKQFGIPEDFDYIEE